MNKSKLFAALLFAYVLSLAFQDFMRLPGVFRKVQLPEMLFLLLVVSFPFNYFRQYRFEKADRLLIGVLSVYWLSNAISSAISGKFSAIAESCGRLYLIVLFGMATLYCAQLPKAALREKAINTAIALGVLLALTGIIGTLSSLAGYPSLMADESLDYPYLGTVFRAQGFTHTPAMMVSIFSIIGVIAAVNQKTQLKTNQKIAAGLFVLLAVFLTLSRSMVLVFWGLGLLIFFQKKGFSKKIFLATAVVTTIIMSVGTHLIFIAKDDPKLPALLKTQFTSNRILYEQGNFEILETCYLSMKKGSIILWSEKPFFGIGTGNFTTGIDRLKTVDLYPQKLPSFEAHSSYLGTLAENGIFGALAVVLLFGLLWSRINPFESVKTDNFSAALLICLTTVIIESIALDTMNFRHYWLLFALIWAYFKVFHAEKTEETKS
jgi:hypothetical protein